MSPYILLFISAFIYSIVTIIESKIINNDNYNIFLIILYITKIILILYIYFNLLSEQNKQDLFTKKYSNLWIICILMTIMTFVAFNIYLKNHKKIGIGKSQIFMESVEIIIVFFLSYYFLSNKTINKNTIIGIIMILIGIYLISNNKLII